MKILVHWHIVSSHIVKYFLIYDVRRHIGIKKTLLITIQKLLLKLYASKNMLF